MSIARNCWRIDRLWAAPALLLGLAWSPLMTCPASAAEPPATRVEVVVDTLHGVTIPDPYRWLEDQDHPETRAWIDAQNRYSRSILEPVAARLDLERRLGNLMRIDRLGASVRERGERFFLWKKRAADDLWILYVRSGLEGADRVLLDPHDLSSDHSVDVELLAISRDGELLAYGVRHGGEDEIEPRIMRVGTGEHLAFQLPRALYTGFDFTAGNQGVIYGIHDRERGGRVYRHVLGAETDEDEVLFGAGRPPEQWVSPSVSEDGRFLLIHVYHGWSRSEVYLKDLSRDGPIDTIVADLDGVFQVHPAGDRLVMLTSWRAPKRRILVIDPEHLAPADWREIVSAGEDPIEDFSVAGGRLFVRSLHNVASRIETCDLDGNRRGELPLPGLGVASVPAGTWVGRYAFFSYQSYTTPRSVLRLEIRSGEVTEWGRDEVPFAGNEYVTSQVWSTSRDGTRVPMFLVHHRRLVPDGDTPTLLYGYGGFNVSQTPYFSSAVAVWLEIGGVYAVANIRGGGEFGEAWHQAGMLAKKQNVFDDFIAAAEWLIDTGYTRPSRLGIWGGSNGGLLVGTVMTQRPELFGAVLCEYPDLDMVRYYQFPNLNKPALAEYGDASNPEHFQFLYAYSPYQHVRDGVAYPAVMLTTGDADTRVPPLQARKMTARLQAATSSDRPILLLYDTKAGHSGGLPLSRQIEQTALRLAFLCSQLGLDDG